MVTARTLAQSGIRATLMLTPSEYESYDATGLAGLVRSGEVSPDDLLSLAMAKAAQCNTALNALVHIDESMARRRIAEGLPDGPLRGVPFLLKDLGAESLDLPGHNGSRLLRDTHYPGNCTLVDRLNAAGLVSFARTTAPEGGIGAVTEAAVYGGPTRSPWHLDHTPGGSSGGSGAAVAAGIVPAAHGSDGGGSIRIPASSCGLFGFKATRARLPEGPFSGEGWAGMATDGFLSRSVRDSAVLLDAVAGTDLGAPYVAPPMQCSYLQSLNTEPSTLRIGLLDTTFDKRPIHPEVRQAVLDTGALLTDLGHEVEFVQSLPDVWPMMQAWTDIVACGTHLWVQSALQRKQRELRDDDIEPVVRSACEYARTLSGAQYLQAVEKVHAFGRLMAQVFRDNDSPGKIDVLLSATLAEPPALIGRLDHSRPDFLDYRLGSDGVFAYSPFTAVFNASGQPAASLPLAWSANGLPIGLHLATAFGEDANLMSLCGQLEKASPWFKRRPAAFSQL